MTTLKAILVDDEPLARRRLRTLLKDHADVEIVAECASGREAVAAIRKGDFDVAFLDIQMPGVDGFGVIEQVGADKMPVVVFVTAHDEHALRAFEVNALDYLLKPFDERRLAVALRRARRQVELRAGGDAAFRERVRGVIADLRSPSPHRSRFAVKSSGRIYFVPVEEVDRVEAAGKYVRLHAGGEVHLHRASISQVETELDPRRFVRIHRSTIVNVHRIKELQPLFHGEFAVILTDGTELTLSRGYRGKLAELLEQPD